MATLGGINLQAQVQPGIPTEFIATARTYVHHGITARQVLTQRMLQQGDGPALQVPTFSDVNAFQFTRGSSIDQYQQFALSSVTISPIWVAVHMMVDEYADQLTSEDLNRIGGRIMAEGINRFEDSDCLDLMDGF